MCSVLAFPSVEDRENIEIAIRNFANTNYPQLRSTMHIIISNILRRNRLKYWPMGMYRVVAVADGIIDIQPRLKLAPDTPQCPGCGRMIFRECTILRIHEGLRSDEYVMGCPCGHVFGVRKGKARDVSPEG